MYSELQCSDAGMKALAKTPMAHLFWASKLIQKHEKISENFFQNLIQSKHLDGKIYDPFLCTLQIIDIDFVLAVILGNRCIYRFGSF